MSICGLRAKAGERLWNCDDGLEPGLLAPLTSALTVLPDSVVLGNTFNSLVGDASMPLRITAKSGSDRKDDIGWRSGARKRGVEPSPSLSWSESSFGLDCGRLSMSLAVSSSSAKWGRDRLPES